MSVMRIDTSGVDALRAGFTALGDDLRDIPGFDSLSQRMATLAQSFAPKRTGELARSIRAEPSKNRASVVARAAHAAVINYGSARRRIRPARFMQRVDAAVAASATSTVQKQVDLLIDKRGLS